MSFRRLRILLLLGVLAAAISLTWLEQTMVRSWRAPLEVSVTPINGDGSAQAAAAIRALKAGDLSDINDFLERELERYGVRRSPAMTLSLQPELAEIPPAPPRDGNVLKIMAWSLKMRWWVYRQSGVLLPELGKIKLFLLYHAPGDGVALEHSLGLQKGLIGVVHVFADPRQQSQNNIVIAHELLHTLGATDKYDPATNLPSFPEGYAEPARGQGAAQDFAEIMAGRTPVSPGRAEMPSGLDATLVGTLTAREIGWGR
jgi:hypothetical protein